MNPLFFVQIRLISWQKKNEVAEYLIFSEALRRISYDI